VVVKAQPIVLLGCLFGLGLGVLTMLVVGFVELVEGKQVALFVAGLLACESIVQLGTKLHSRKVGKVGGGKKALKLAPQSLQLYQAIAKTLLVCCSGPHMTTPKTTARWPFPHTFRLAFKKVAPFVACG